MIDNIENKKLVIALDAMGGDTAPDSVINGAESACSKYDDIEFLIYGDENKIAPLLEKTSKLKNSSKLIHTDDFVTNEDKPSFAIRKRRNSSMSLAIKSVKRGEAVAVVSGGNTGALMAISKIALRTLTGIDRPAICGLMPTERGNCVMLDLGANVICDANNLFEFAVMGDAFARIILGIKSPSIGLLNIGAEEMKGNEAVKAASEMLRESELSLNFYGHIEGDDIGKGTTDVVVTDGFTGNVALKTAEGTAKMYTSFLKKALTSSLIAKSGALLVRPSFSIIRNKLDPRTHNGAMILGLNGIVVKSHGGTDAIGFSNAIGVAVKLARHDINRQIIKEMIESGHIPPEDDENGNGK